MTNAYNNISKQHLKENKKIKLKPIQNIKEQKVWVLMILLKNNYIYVCVCTTTHTYLYIYITFIN